MRFVLVGATGFIGSRILAEAVERGHLVTALCRHPANVLKHANVDARFADVVDTASLQLLFSGHDAIVHSYAPPFDEKVRADADKYGSKLSADGRPGMEAVATYRPAVPVAHQPDGQPWMAGWAQGTRS